MLDFYLWLENRISLMEGEGLGLFITVLHRLHSLLGLEQLRQEREGKCYEGHGSWVGASLVLAPSHQLQARHGEGLTLVIPHLQPVESEVLNYFNEESPLDLGKCSANESKPSPLCEPAAPVAGWCFAALLCSVGTLMVIFMSPALNEEHSLSPQG